MWFLCEPDVTLSVNQITFGTINENQGHLVQKPTLQGVTNYNIDWWESDYYL